MASSSVPDMVEFALALLASGALAGLLAGLFGASGGLVIVPVLHPLFTALRMQDGMVVYLAAAVSIGLMVLTGARALFQRGTAARAGAVPSRVWLWPIPACAVAASVVVAALPGPEMQFIFTVAILAGAVKMLFFSDAAAAGTGAAGTVATVGGEAEPALGLSATAIAVSWQRALNGAVRGVGHLARSPAIICALLAIPAVVGLAMAAFGEPRLPAGLIGYVNAFGVVVILLTASLLAPVGAELSGQFPKRVLEVSFGVFLLLVAAEFALALVM